MQNNAAVFRDGPVLEEGVIKLADLYNQMEDLKVFYAGKIHSFSANSIEYIENTDTIRSVLATPSV